MLLSAATPRRGPTDETASHKTNGRTVVDYHAVLPIQHETNLRLFGYAMILEVVFLIRD